MKQVYYWEMRNEVAEILTGYALAGSEWDIDRMLMKATGCQYAYADYSAPISGADVAKYNVVFFENDLSIPGPILRDAYMALSGSYLSYPGDFDDDGWQDVSAGEEGEGTVELKEVNHAEDRKTG